MKLVSLSLCDSVFQNLFFHSVYGLHLVYRNTEYKFLQILAIMSWVGKYALG